MIVVVGSPTAKDGRRVTIATKLRGSVLKALSLDLGRGVEPRTAQIVQTWSRAG
jgi:hypothetical protein